MKEEIANRKKKLLVTGSTFPRWEGDTEPRFVLDLANELTQYYNVSVLVPAAPGARNKERMGNVNVIRYHYFPVRKCETLCYPGAIVPRIKEKKIRVFLVPFLLMALWWNLFKLRNEFDYIHAHWLIPQGIIQSYFKTPYIVTGHGGDVTSLNNGIVSRMKKRSLKKAAHVTVVSNHLKNEVIKIYNKNNVSVLPMGCQTSLFGKEHRIENYFDQNGKAVVLFVGRLAEKKGVTYLIDAIKDVDAKLVIVGSGPLEAELKEQAKEQGDKIVFLGAKTHDELRAIYASADVFVAPSVTAKDGDQEGFGLVLLEAMASGIPVVASKSGGIVEVIKHGENGLLAIEKDRNDLAEKINIALLDLEMRDKILKGSKETVKKYDYKSIAEKYMKLFESIG